MGEYVRTETADGVATVTIDRAERHNSLVPDLLDELTEQITALVSDPTTRAVVLRTAGSSFSTGGDVRGFYDNRDDLATYAERTVGGLNDAMLGLMDLDVPVIAAVDGPVTGGSLGLLLASDVVLVGPDATITPYYAVVGFSPDGGWTAILPDVVGRARTMAVIATNETIEPAQAVEWGVASRLIEDGDVHDAAGATADEIASMKSGSIARTKRLLATDRDTIADGLASERRAFVEQVQTEEALEGMKEFLE